MILALGNKGIEPESELVDYSLVMGTTCVLRAALRHKSVSMVQGIVFGGIIIWPSARSASLSQMIDPPPKTRRYSAT